MGLLGDDSKSIQETIGYLKNFDADTIQVSSAIPFPGTEFFNHAEKNNLLKSKEWEKYDGKFAEVLHYENIDFDEMKKLRSRVLRKWFLRRLFSREWLLRQSYYFFRIIRGLGAGFVFKQVSSILKEETFLKNS